MKKLFSKELIVLWVSLAALIFAALSLNSSLNQLLTRRHGILYGGSGYEKKEPDQRSDRTLDFRDCAGMRSAEYACCTEPARKGLSKQNIPASACMRPARTG